MQTKEYGICNFVYKSRTPFHPARLRAFLHEFAAVLDLDEGDEEGDEEEVFDMDDDMDDMDDTDADTDDIERHGNAMAMPLEHRKAETNAKLATARDLYGVVYRSKGFVWIAGRDDMCGEWGHAGAVLQLGCGGPWMGLLPAEMWPEDGSDERDALERDFGTFIFISVRAIRETNGVFCSQSTRYSWTAGRSWCSSAFA